MLERNTKPRLLYQHFLNYFISSVLLCIFSAIVQFSTIIQILIFPYKKASYASIGIQTISTTSSDVQSSQGHQELHLD